MPEEKLDISDAIYNVEKRSKTFYESRIKPVQSEPEETKSYSRHKKAEKPKLKFARTDLSSLKIREQEIAAPALTSFKVKPLPTDDDAIEKIFKEEKKKEEESDDKFFWFGSQGVKKHLLWTILILIILIGLTIFGITYLKGAKSGWFQDVFNQTINNTNTCNPIVQTQPAICNMSCGTTIVNLTLSPNIIAQVNLSDTNST